MRMLKGLVCLLATLPFASAVAQDFKPVGATLLAGVPFEIFYDSEQDQTVLVKSKTSPSKDPEEESSFKNILNRQALYEVGISVGVAHATQDALLVTNAQGQKVAYGDQFGVPTEIKNNSRYLTVHFNYHPPVDSLKRLTLGVEGRTFMGYSGPNDSRKHAESFSVGALHKNLGVMAEYDFIVLPSKRGGMAISAGYTFQTQAFSQAYDGQSVSGDRTNDHFASFRWRWIRDTTKKGSYFNSAAERGTAVTDYFIGGRVSKSGAWSISAGFIYAIGKKSSPKTEKVK